MKTWSQLRFNLYLRQKATKKTARRTVKEPTQTMITRKVNLSSSSFFFPSFSFWSSEKILSVYLYLEPCACMSSISRIMCSQPIRINTFWAEHIRVAWNKFPFLSWNNSVQAVLGNNLKLITLLVNQTRHTNSGFGYVVLTWAVRQICAWFTANITTATLVASNLRTDVAYDIVNNSFVNATVVYGRKPSYVNTVFAALDSRHHRFFWNLYWSWRIQNISGLLHRVSRT